MDNNYNNDNNNNNYNASTNMNMGANPNNVDTNVNTNTNSDINPNINYNASTSMNMGVNPNNAGNENISMGIIGALLGSLVGLIPTILLYLIGFFSYAGGVCLGYASAFGYKLLKGPNDNKKKMIIVLVSSIICITVCMLVFVPMIELNKAGIDSTNLSFFYSVSDAVRITITNYILALVFTIAGVVGYLKKN